MKGKADLVWLMTRPSMSSEYHVNVVFGLQRVPKKDRVFGQSDEELDHTYHEIVHIVSNAFQLACHTLAIQCTVCVCLYNK